MANTDVQPAAGAPQAETREADEFTALLKQSFRPKSERAATDVENAVTTLVREALKGEGVIKEDVLDTVEGIIARIDEKLSVQMNAVIHSPGFQQIESAGAG